MFYLLFFLGLGCIVGSFLNVVLIRTDREESFVGGRSHCDSCEKLIPWYDNIPLLSFLVLRGRCRFCHKNIPSAHLWMELGTGITFSFLGGLFFDPWSTQSWFMTGWLLVLVSFLILIVVTDFSTMEIPLIFLILVNLVTFSYLLGDWILFGQEQAFLVSHFWESILGGVLSWAFFFALVYFSKETWMGWGDVWIGLLAGMVVGKDLILIMLTLSFASGALYGIALMIREGKDLKTQVPFAPFLVFGMFGTFLLNHLFPSLFQFFLW